MGTDDLAIRAEDSNWAEVLELDPAAISAMETKFQMLIAIFFSCPLADGSQH